MPSFNLQQTGYKWLVGILCFLSIIVGLCIYTVYGIIAISRYNEINNQIDRLELGSNKCTIMTKEFLLNAYTDQGFAKTGTSLNYQNFKYSLKNVLSLMNEFRQSSFIDNDFKRKKLNELSKYLLAYQNCFDKIASLYKQKGFKDLGLEGQMRNSIHFIEQHKAPIDLEYLLKLRRHEKDFLLRKDLSYIEKFDDDLIKFRNHIRNHNKIYLEYDRTTLLAALENYNATFKNIVEIEKQIGLNQNEGLRNGLTTNISNAERILIFFDTEIRKAKANATSQINFIIISLIVVFAFIIVATIYSVSFFVDSVTKPISRLNQAADLIAQGNLSANLSDLKSNKLMNSLVESFEKIVVKLRTTMFQIQQISARKAVDLVELNNEEDEIGKLLNQMILEMKEIDQNEKQRNWANEGFAIFSEILRNNLDQNMLYDVYIREIVKYLSANQAGLFVLNHSSDEESLELVATYAFNRKKYINKSLKVGEGLVGQCFYEKETIFLKDVPSDYLEITSGLGSASPRCILMVPLIYNNQIEGVLELASFQELKNYEIAFVERICEILASAILNVANNDKTKILLEESQLRAVQLKARDEEMRLKMEELLATQEEMKRKEESYKTTIDELTKEMNIILEDSKKSSETTAHQIKDREVKRNHDELNHFRAEITRKNRYPRMIEHFLGG
jgi:GAF domain-containing protein